MDPQDVSAEVANAVISGLSNYVPSSNNNNTKKNTSDEDLVVAIEKVGSLITVLDNKDAAVFTDLNTEEAVEEAKVSFQLPGMGN